MYDVELLLLLAYTTEKNTWIWFNFLCSPNYS